MKKNNMFTSKLYFDATATKQLSAELLADYCQNLQNYYANPAAVYADGLASKQLIQKSMQSLARYFSVDSRQLIVTSGATESTNTAFYNMAKRRRQQDILLLAAGEHQASQAAAYRLADELNLQLKIVPLGKDYRMDLTQLQELLKQYGERILALSNLSVSNETGTINDLMAIRQLLNRYAPKCLWHIDNVQGWGKIYLDYKELQVDYVTLAGHKIGAPKGIGLLYIREMKYFKPFIVGGGQQGNYRSGTENPPLVAALAKANDMYCQLKDLNANWQNLSHLRKLLLSELNDINFVLHETNDSNYQYPGVLSISFPHVRGEVLLHTLEKYGISVSTSSSCHNLASPQKQTEIFGEPIFRGEDKDNHLRITFTIAHSEEDIKYLAKAIKESLNILKVHN